MEAGERKSKRKAVLKQSSAATKKSAAEAAAAEAATSAEQQTNGKAAGTERNRCTDMVGGKVAPKRRPRSKGVPEPYLLTCTC